MADIFISYSKQSKAEAEQLANELRAKGLTVWYDTSLIAGDSFGEVILSELAQARAAIVIWDSASVKSEWVRSEASRARARRILIPVRSADIRSHDIPPPFDSLHTESVSNRAAIESALAKLGVTSGAAAANIAKPTLALPDKPSIAVLSFTNMTGSSEQDCFGDGIAEDIITMLSRSHSLFVIARNSSFTYKGRAVDVKQIARELGVRYVLEGSVRRGGNRVRITAQLIDAETGNHLWAEKYDRDLSDIFAVQDEITDAVATAIEPAIAQMERHRAVRKPPGSLGAWEAYQRGLWHMGRIGAEDNETAKGFFRQAIDLDPTFALAYAHLSLAIFQAGALPDALAEAHSVSRRAVALDPAGTAGYVSLARGRFWQGDHEGTLTAARQALAISPNDATAFHQFAMALLFSGRPQEALEPIRKSIRLNPHDSGQTVRSSQIVMAYYLLRDYEAAVAAGKEGLHLYPDHPWTYRWLAAALGQIGRMDEAKQALEKAIVVAPKVFDMYVRERPPWMRPADHHHMLEGLRKAGWEG